jgi:hypothetical protein
MEDAHHAVRSQPGQQPWRTFTTWVAEQPIRAAIYAHIAIGILAAISFGAQVSFGPKLAPDNPGQLLQSAWQVHAGFSAIAFAGLVMLVDMAGRESNVSATSERRFLLKHTNFEFALTFALIGAMLLAIAATWLSNEENLFIAIFLVIAPSTFFVARGYLRAVRVLTHPRYATMVEHESITRAMKLSVEASTAKRIANSWIDAVIERTWPQTDRNTESLVMVENDGFLADVNIHTLRRALNAPSGPQVGQGPPLAKPPESLEIKLLASIGERVRAGGFLFVASRNLSDSERARLGKDLRATVRFVERIK